MELRFLEFDDGTESAIDYLQTLDDERAHLITQRLALLRAFAGADRLPDPPVSPIAGIEGVFQFVVDYRGEVHRVAFGPHRGIWLVVAAIRCDVDPIGPADLARISAAWDARPT